MNGYQEQGLIAKWDKLLKSHYLIYLALKDLSSV